MNDDFEFSTALLSPVSDLVGGDPGAKSEGIFGRGGNDTIYGFDPGTNNNGNQNIDLLFGDLFDNSLEEFQIILDIQAGNPLAILDRGKPPSVGADRFVLGDENQPYYTSFDPAALTTTNFLGLDKFAVLYDFEPTEDIIQLNGKKKDYQLVEIDGLQIEGIEQPASGELIFSLQEGAPDLVAYVISTPEVDLDLGKKYFRFVGDKPEKKPEDKKIGQLGTTGIDTASGAATDPSGNVYITGATSGALGGKNQGFVDAWVAKYNSNGNQEFLKQIGSAGSESALAVATDKEGNYYLAGGTGGSLVAGKQSSSEDAWVAKYDSSGNKVWGKQIGTPLAGGYANPALGLDVDDNGNVYLSGIAIKENQDRETFDFAVEDDSWVTKFNSSGERQWFTPIDTPFFNESYDLAVDRDGNSYAVGWTQGLVKESDPSRDFQKYDAWIAKHNTAGQIEWIQQFGSSNEGLEFAWGVDTDSQGNIYVTGWTTGELGTKDKKFEKSDSFDIWLTKFTPDGTQQWTKQIGSKGDDGMFFSDLHIDAQDNIFLTGYTNDKLGKGKEDKKASNVWVARFDTEGNNKWVQQFGGKDNIDYGTDLSADGNGNLYVTGFTEAFLGNNGDISGANGSAVDAWIAQLDVEKGKLQKFIGNNKDVVSEPNPGSVPTTDISNVFVTDEQLPSGDNRIDLTEGLDTTISVVDYGQIVSNLGGIFEDPFRSALTEAFESGEVQLS
jgi:hypothetical protein